MEFFRHCPACGRRFRIKLEAKRLVRLERTSISKAPAPRRSVSQFRGSPVLIVQEGRPVITNIEEFQYAYKCKHCGHELSEKHIESRREA